MMHASKDVAALKACFPTRDFTILVIGEQPLFRKTWKAFITTLKAKWEYMLNLHAAFHHLVQSSCLRPWQRMTSLKGSLATLGAKLGPNTHPLCLASLPYNRNTMMTRERLSGFE